MNIMRRIAAVCVVAIVAGAGLLFSPSGTRAQAQDAPHPAAPVQEHQWLQQLVGDWDVQVEGKMGPDQPPMKCQGTERVRSVGRLWVIGESKMDLPDAPEPMTGVLTLGYDPEKKKYIGTWIDSMTSYLWEYEGTLDPAGKVLTLQTQGPNPMLPGKISKYKETIEVKGEGHKTFTSAILGEDGQWFTFMTADYRRKK